MSLFKKKSIHEEMYEYLTANISEKMGLAEMVGVFEQMCRIPSSEGVDMKLFETGTFTFTGEPLFYFCLTRQIPNNDEEYYQIQLRVMFAPSEENKRLEGAVWDEDIEEDFFEYVRKSEACHLLKDREILKREVSIDET